MIRYQRGGICVCVRYQQFNKAINVLSIIKTLCSRSLSVALPLRVVMIYWFTPTFENFWCFPSPTLSIQSNERAKDFSIKENLSNIYSCRKNIFFSVLFCIYLFIHSIHSIESIHTFVHVWFKAHEKGRSQWKFAKQTFRSRCCESFPVVLYFQWKVNVLFTFYKFRQENGGFSKICKLICFINFLCVQPLQ